MKICLLFILLMSSSVFAQDKLVKKLEKELGHELVPVDPDYSKKIDSIKLEVIWSRTIDTTIIGSRYGNEFVRYEPSNVRMSIKYPTYILEDPINKREFLAFRKWIQDSIAREKAYFNLAELEGASRWINYQEFYFLTNEGRTVQFDPSLREENRQYFPLNWKYKFEYDDPELYPFFRDMYVPPTAGFRGDRPLDVRKILYEERNVGNIRFSQLPIFIDQYSFARYSKNDFDAMTVLGYLYEVVELDTPISFIEPFMAAAYCRWKTDQWNKLHSGSNYQLTFRLPNEYEIVASGTECQFIQSIPERDYTDQWKITNAEYKEFSQYRLDSLCREFLYQNEPEDEIALSLLDYDNYYYSEADLEYVMIEPRDRVINRELFPWSKKPIKWKLFEYNNSEEVLAEMQLETIPVHYYWMDARSRSVEGMLHAKPRPVAYQGGIWIPKLIVKGIDENGNPLGKSLGLDGFTCWNDLDYCNDALGTRSHENFGRFIRRESTTISLPNSIPENELIADITYEQALAYYNWKYRIDKFEEGDDWQQFVFPSEDEFERIKNGQTIVHPAEDIQYDSPVFRMVIELQPKK